MEQPAKKKIVYLIGTLQIGGAEWQMVDTVTRLNRDMFLPKLYCLFDGGHFQEYVERRHVDVTVFHAGRKTVSKKRSMPFWRFRALLSLYRFLRREHPEIVHCYMYKPSIYGAIAAKLAGVPIILTHRLRLGYFKQTKPHYQLMENLVNRFVTAVIVNAQAVKDDVLQRERIAADKIKVVHAGVDIQRYCPQNGRAPLDRALHQRTKLGIPENAPVIGMVANLFAYKGYREFIQAAAHVHQQYPATRFLCVGRDCGIQRQLEHLIRDSGLQQHAILTGEVHNVADLLHLLDMQVSASYEEGFSSAILEGMAIGKPIIATAVGGTPEAVVHNHTGLLVPPRNSEALAQAMLFLLENPEFATTLGHNGRKRIEEHFSMQQTVATLETFYRQVSESCTQKS
jgi:glycosyltransferase involved in cell wall biosynthesis